MLVLGTFGRMATSRAGLALIAGFLLLQAWWLIRPDVPPLDPARAAAADRVAEDIAEALGEANAGAWAGRYVAVAPLAGDDTGYLRARLEEVLHAHANCRVITDTVFTEIRGEAAAKAARLGVVSRPRADRWKPAPVIRLTESLGYGRARGADFVVYGAVPEFRLGGAGVALTADVAVADVGAGGLAFRQRFTDGGPAAFASFMPGDENARAGRWLMGWLLFVALLPLATGGIWRNVLANESARANLAALLFLTALDGLLAWALLGFSLHTVWLKGLFGIACLAALAWNLTVLAWYERARAEAAYSV